MQDLFARRAELERLCEEDLREMREASKSHRTAAIEYKRELSLSVLKWREKGFPAALVEHLAKGDEDTANSRARMDYHANAYEIAREAHLLHRMLLKQTNQDIEREWCK